MVSSDDSDAALRELKRLLLGAEAEQIGRLSRRLDDLGVRAQDLADVLPRAVRLHQRNPEDLVDALESPVTECVQRSVSRDPQRFADALFPVMGPAIRRAISEALKGLVQSLNQALEHSFSPKGIAWRIEAARSGVPFGEVVLRHTLVYRVEQAFLIQPASGLLMANVADHAAIGQDPDAVSGMLTAIESFVRDAFAADADESLETLNVGDRTVWLMRGPYALLACVIRGTPPMSLRVELQAVAEGIHRQFGQGLRDFDGDPDAVAGVEAELDHCLLSEQRADARKRRGFSPILVVLLLALCAGFAWWGYGAWKEMRAAAQREAAAATLVERLNDTPGFVVTSHRWQAGRLSISGLRDPVTADPGTLINDAGLVPEQVQFNWRRYQDLSPSFVLARARRALAPPPGTELAVSDAGVLQISGTVPGGWLQKATSTAPLIAGITAVDASGILDRDQALLRAVQAAVGAPEGVTLAVKDAVLHVTGTASLGWRQALAAALSGIDGLKGVDTRELSVQEAVALDALVRELNQTRLTFAAGAGFGTDQTALLSATADMLRRATTLARQLGRQLRVQVTGRTDGIGSLRANTELARQRAKVFIGAMIARGVPGEVFVLRALPQSRNGTEDALMRRVDLAVSAVPSSPSGG